MPITPPPRKVRSSQEAPPPHETRTRPDPTDQVALNPAHLRPDNPTRLLPPATSSAAPLIAPDGIDKRNFIRERGGSRGQQQATITLIARHASPGAPARIGVCVRTQTRLISYPHPVGRDLDEDLPHALETALLRLPPLTDILITTPYKHLWDVLHYTPKSREHLAALGCRLTHAHPLPHDLGLALARTAAQQQHPVNVDAHLYTAAIQDPERCYLAALLWQQGLAHHLITTTQGDLLSSEASAASWAARTLPPHASVMIHNTHPDLMRLWQHPERMSDQLAETLRPLGRLIGSKGLQVRQHADPPHRALIRATRELAATHYAHQN